jgi:hypothetical protein
LVPPTCDGYSGDCANGVIASQTSRRQENHCATCNGGYYMTTTNACAAWGGTCANGQIKTQADRLRDSDCDWCNDGYYLETSTHSCTAYSGDCTNGVVKSQALRLRDDHCDSCNTGSVLHGIDFSFGSYGMDGLSCESCAAVAEGVTGWAGSTAVLTNVPDEIVGSKLYPMSFPVSAGTSQTLRNTDSSGHNSDVYFFYEDNGAITAPTSGWTELPGMAYDVTSYSSCNSKLYSIVLNMSMALKHD